MLHRPCPARRALALALAVVPIAAPTAATELQPHRAVYRMTLAGATQATDIVAASGVMLYRFDRACDGWTVENKTVLRLGYENEATMQTVWTFASWESFDGRKFRYRARYEQEGQKTERITGAAELPGAAPPAGGAGDGEARFSEPDERRLTLPAGTLFPTAHMQAVLAAAAAGDKHLNRVVFDGASLENPYQVNAFFGPLATADVEALAQRAKLPALPSWWTRMAFFPIASPAATPEFEIDAHYRADGIADAIRQSFDNFSLDVRLHEVELLPSPDC